MTETDNQRTAFFSNCKHFPTVESNCIETIEFLNASKDVVKFVELLGKAFIPVRNDINGNITKILEIYETNPLQYKYLHEILKSESDSNVGTDALIWLTRALTYNHIFLSLLVLDFQNGNKSQDLSPLFYKAYEQSLKKYHNWFVQQICSLCLLAAPGRDSLLKYLSANEENIDENVIFDAIKVYLITLDANISAINSIFNERMIEY